MLINRKLLVVVVCACLFLQSAHANPFVIVGAFSNVLSSLVKVIDHSQKSTVIVENHGRHHAHMWCASKDDRIGDKDGVWVQPGQSLGWSFHKKKNTQFWCTMDWYGRRYGWDVFVANWRGQHGRWVIRDDGIYNGDNGPKRMDLESNVPV
ncbi:hypothetical protein GCK72_007864 [Caenorhabditis remanei]|uniref:S-protein homolog n=1 Tax=Caenorhabditis remanei TaxID=31234 RepID=A0A6A5HMS8_CAERE|nr:hypothetical protein GCK72_007864 [Caenorhabditis remanei]KAF1767904.1 hypothetical protein GCK72_007864 [Caenorhabditis remanei]